MTIHFEVIHAGPGYGWHVAAVTPAGKSAVAGPYTSKEAAQAKALEAQK